MRVIMRAPRSPANSIGGPTNRKYCFHDQGSHGDSAGLCFFFLSLALSLLCLSLSLSVSLSVSSVCLSLSLSLSLSISLGGFIVCLGFFSVVRCNCKCFLKDRSGLTLMATKQQARRRKETATVIAVLETFFPVDWVAPYDLGFPGNGNSVEKLKKCGYCTVFTKAKAITLIPPLRRERRRKKKKEKRVSETFIPVVLSYPTEPAKC